jgi:hypothetical protein
LVWCEYLGLRCAACCWGRCTGSHE